MKDGLLTTLIIIGLMSIVCIFVFILRIFSDSHCRKMYGNEWRSSGYYTQYCTNKAGDIKGY